MHAAALERLDVVAAPAPSKVAPLEAVLSALRATQQALEATQTSTFGAEVTCLLPALLVPPPCLRTHFPVYTLMCGRCTILHVADLVRGYQVAFIQPSWLLP